MNITWDLCKMFPTEESRYNAFFKYTWFCYAVGLLDIIGSIIFRETIVPDFIMLILGIFSFYITVYCWYKAKVFHYIYKLVIGLLLSFLIMFIIIAIAKSEGLAAILPFLGIIMAMVANRKRWGYLKANKRYLIVPFLFSLAYPLLNFIILNMLTYNTIFKMYYREAMLVSSNLSVLLSLLIYVLLFKTEQNQNTPFLEIYYKSIAVPLTFMFLIMSWITLFSSALFKDNILLNDPTDANSIDFSGHEYMNQEIVDNYSDTVDTPIMDSTDIATCSDGPIFGNGFEPHSVEGLGTFYDNNTLLFADNTVVETSINIPNFENNPYLLLSTHPMHGNFVFNDASGLQQFKVVDNILYDSTNTQIGTFIHGNGNITVLNDMNNNPIWSIDSQNNLYTGSPSNGQLAGHIAKSGTIETLFDIKGHIVSYKNATGSVFTEMSKPLGGFKNI